MLWIVQRQMAAKDSVVFGVPRQAWGRLRAWTRARVRERVTASGMGFIIATALTGAAAFLSANNLLFLLLAAMGSMLLASNFLSRLSLSGLELDIFLPDHICARRSVSARIRLRNEKRFIPSFSIHLSGVEEGAFTGQIYFPAIEGGSSVEEMLDVHFQRRGLHTEDTFRFSSRFPFAFAERRMNVTVTRDVIVYPALDPRPGFESLAHAVAGEAEARLQGRGHDFYRIRPYQSMESARHVDWRATAHTGQLQVREFAREQEPSIALSFDLQAGASDEVWFEEAIECCAFLAWTFSGRGARLRFRTQEIDLITPVEADVYAILKNLALVERKRRCQRLDPLAEDSVQLLFSAREAGTLGGAWPAAVVFGPSHRTLPTGSTTRLS
ncbi:MAG: DUF58 domain-containing protein [Bryobacteraceae bacterium]|nr:DUF58 domain-containing protein [Bryobacteraceae bacterium]